MNEHSLAYVEKDTIIHRADSLSKVIWVILVVVFTFQFKESTTRAIMLASLLFVALFLARIPLKVIWKASPLIFGVALLLGFFHVSVTQTGKELFEWQFIRVTSDGLEDGLGYFFRLATMVMVSFLLIWTTDIRDLMTGLVKIGMPYRFAFSLFMALRFLPMVQAEVDAVQAAHAIRGRASKSQISHRFKLWQRYMFTVIVNGLRKAENTAVAIETRGFGAYPDRTFVKEFHWTVIGVALAVIYLALGIGLLVWERTK